MRIKFEGGFVEIRQALEELSLFEGIGLEALDHLAQGASWRNYASGEFIFHQGAEKGGFHVLYSGVMKLFRSTAEGKDQTVYLAESGEPFCLCTLYGSRTMPVSALAMTPCQVLVFPGTHIEEYMRHSPHVLLNIVRVLNNRLMHSYRMIEDLGLRSIQQRVASFLLHAARSGGGQEIRVMLSVSRLEVSKILGTTPETISRVLAHMCQDGLIEARGREIAILDRQGLEDMAG